MAQPRTEQLLVAREIHEQVIPPLQAVAMALSSDGDLTADERDLFARGIRSALAELRSLLAERLVPREQGPRRSIAEILGGLRARHAELPVTVTGPADFVLPSALEPLVEHYVSEAFGNARRHARPTIVNVVIDRRPTILCIDIDNDGAHANRTRPGIGLQLAVEHALQHNALINWSQPAPHRWRTRLTIPIESG